MGSIAPALVPLGIVFLHTIAIYLFLILCLAVVGRREIAQLTAVEVVIILVLGSAIETSMVAGNTTLPAGLVSAATLMIANRLLTILLRRSRPLRQLLIGGPILLVHDGRLIAAHLRQAGLTEANVLEAIRERGYDGLDDVRDAILEVDGAVSVLAKDAPTHRGQKLARASGRPLSL